MLQGEFRQILMGCRYLLSTRVVFIVPEGRTTKPYPQRHESDDLLLH
jgi:hypothetical protein